MHQLTEIYHLFLVLAETFLKSLLKLLELKVTKLCLKIKDKLWCLLMYNNFKHYENFLYRNK